MLFYYLCTVGEKLHREAYPQGAQSKDAEFSRTTVNELWAACDDSREKFTGIVDRIEFQFWKDFDWKAGRWNR